MKLGNNINIYTWTYSSFIVNNGKINKVIFGARFGRSFLDQTYCNNSILIGTYDFNYSNNTYTYYIQLNLIREPYNEISKIVNIEDYLVNSDIKLIALKNNFVFFRLKKGKMEIYNANFTYNILDLNLNFINSLTVKYEIFTDIKLTELSENNKINEFMILS